MEAKNLNILSTREWDSFAALVKLDGCSSGGDVGLDGYAVDFTIEVTNSQGQTEKFVLTMESEERLNGMKNYSGWEMVLANEGDHEELASFLNYEEDDILEALEKEAERLAKEKLGELKQQWIDDRFPEEVDSLENLLLFMLAFDDIEAEGDDRWAVSLLEERYENIKFLGYGYVADELPTFGGEEPENTEEVWSWDAENLLVGTCSEDYMVVSRKEVTR